MGSNKAATVAVVIVNFNRKDDLRRALASVAAQSYEPLEVVVVDNASSDDSAEMVAREFPGVRLLRLPENIGMDGYSEGFKAARGEIVFQMDNDSLMPGPGVLSAVVERFRALPQDVAVVATRVEEYGPGGDIDTLRCKDLRGGPMDTGGFHSGGVAFRASALHEVGYYNRDVFLYGAELFLEMKFLSAGYKIFYYPEILMLHCSSGTARSHRGVYYEVRNRYWYMRLYGTSWQRVRFLPQMVLYDLIYAVRRGAGKQFGRAVRDGFSSLPASLGPRTENPRERFGWKVEEVGKRFSLGWLLSRTLESRRMV